MKRSLRYMLVVAFLVAITAVTASAMAFSRPRRQRDEAVRKPEGTHSSRSSRAGSARPTRVVFGYRMLW